jgi:hypothetical protein
VRTDTGDKIVDWYMDIACDEQLPATVRMMARAKLRSFALRQPHETVEDIDGPAN